MKRILTLLLALALTLGLSVPALAVDPQQAQTSAQLLYNLNLFRGVGTNPDGSVNFDLDRAPTRAEAVTMLVRLLGAEDEAMAQSWSTPFTDLPDWTKPYVGYAYNRGYTKGISDTLFGSDSPVTAAQYLTFLLRSMDYRDGTDFTWDSPWTLTDKLGITEGDYNSQTEFLRGDAVYVSENALHGLKKDSSLTLLEHLLSEGAIKDSGVVIWDYSPVIFEEDFASFLFYPAPGSPASFRSFKLDKVTINGQSCQTLQVNTSEDVAAYLASIGQDAGGFAYVEISYDQDAALEAADQTYTDENGRTYPLLGFTFSYTATQQDGQQISGTFTDYFYLDTND